LKLDRLVSILVLLLRKEKVQAKEMAEIFDVSVRTILRDVEAINLAGIPIVTYQGANGGIATALIRACLQRMICLLSYPH